MKIFGVILAGGDGGRLGQVRKADLRLNGTTMLDRVTARLRAVERPLLLSVNGKTEPADCPYQAIPDLPIPLAGPLAGIIAAALHLSAEKESDAILVSVAVDTPFLPEDYVMRLGQSLEAGGLAAQSVWGTNYYPTNAAWRLSALAELTQEIANDTCPRSPKALLRQLAAREVDWSESHGLDPFASLNTLGDLVALSRRATGGGE